MSVGSAAAAAMMFSKRSVRALRRASMRAVKGRGVSGCVVVWFGVDDVWWKGGI